MKKRFLIVLVLLTSCSIHHRLRTEPKADGCLEDSLALPAIPFRTEIEHNKRLTEELKELKVFIERHAPGAHIVVTIDSSDFREAGFERLPFTWRGMNIWIKRTDVLDHHPSFEGAA